LQTRNAVVLRIRSSPSRNRLLRATNTVATRFAMEPLPARAGKLHGDELSMIEQVFLMYSLRRKQD
jgi:hypothetical protein